MMGVDSTTATITHIASEKKKMGRAGSRSARDNPGQQQHAPLPQGGVLQTNVASEAEASRVPVSIPTTSDAMVNGCICISNQHNKYVECHLIVQHKLISSM